MVQRKKKLNQDCLTTEKLQYQVFFNVVFCSVRVSVCTCFSLIDAAHGEIIQHIFYYMPSEQTYMLFCGDCCFAT